MVYHMSHVTYRLVLLQKITDALTILWVSLAKVLHLGGRRKSDKHVNQPYLDLELSHREKDLVTQAYKLGFVPKFKRN